MPAQELPLPKPRNKLRKLSKQRRPEPLIITSTARTSTDSSGRNSNDGRGRLMPSSPLPCIATTTVSAAAPPPPDLSSPKWHEYVNRKSGLLYPMATSPHLQHTRSRSPAAAATPSTKSATSLPSPNVVVPEFAHLAVNDTPRSSFQSARSSTELSTPSLPSCTDSSRLSPASSTSVMRRYAKTPVHRIGQLEGEPVSPLPLPSPTRRLEMDKPETVDRIAEQYIALLSARSHDDLRSDDHDQHDEDESQCQARQHSVDVIRSAISRRASPPLRPPPPPPPPLERQLTPPQLTMDPETTTTAAAEASPGGSPTSDGTLVDFEEDAIYFKPAFSPEALSPIFESEFDNDDDDDLLERQISSLPPLALATPPERSSLGLQICMDLLQRELSATMRRGWGAGDGGASAASEEVQVWMMIEAYERLRDRVAEMRLAREERKALERMFESWLGALYRMHGEVSGGNGEFQTVNLD